MASPGKGKAESLSYGALVAAVESLAVDSGVVSFPVAVHGNDLRDTTKNWAAGAHKNRLVKIISGLGSGQLAVIDGNSANTLSIRGTWPQAIGAGANYVIVGQDLMQELRGIFGAGGEVDLNALDDGLQSIQLEHRLERSLDDFFNARAWMTGAPSVRVPLDDYWLAAGFTVPAEKRGAGCYSRKVFSYPSLQIHAKLPNITTGDYWWWLGFEAGGAVGTGIFCLYGRGDINRVYVMAGERSDLISKRIETFLPVGYDTAEKDYLLKINRMSGELYIEGVLKAVVLFGLQEAIPSWENNEPYTLFSTKTNLAAVIATLIEVNKGVATTTPRTLPLKTLAVNDFVASDGDPCPPRQYALYTQNTSTKWKALATAGAVLTSHPVPVWGYPMKTLVFQADAAGNLDIQVYVGGGWRSWVPGGITLVANQLEVYNLNGEVPIVRCVYTPTNADTITLAEWLLE